MNNNNNNNYYYYYNKYDIKSIRHHSTMISLMAIFSHLFVGIILKEYAYTKSYMLLYLLHPPHSNSKRINN